MLVVELSQRYQALALDNERLRAENKRLGSEAAKNSGIPCGLMSL